MTRQLVLLGLACCACSVTPRPVVCPPCPPAPPPRTITVTVPGPCAPPEELPAPNLWILGLSAEAIATLSPEVVEAIEHDLRELAALHRAALRLLEQAREQCR